MQTGAVVLFTAWSAAPAAGAGSTANVARDPQVAVVEEYEDAVRSGEADRLRLFIARHPESPLAQRAQRRLERFRQK